MRGHEQLIAMRMRGLRPRLVFIDAGIDGLKCWRDWHELTPQHAYVEVPDTDPISSLDLDFCVGLTVQISGPNEGRVMALRQLALESGAKRVLSAFVTVATVFGEPAATVHKVIDSLEAA